MLATLVPMRGRDTGSGGAVNETTALMSARRIGEESRRPAKGCASHVAARRRATRSPWRHSEERRFSTACFYPDRLPRQGRIGTVSAQDASVSVLTAIEHQRPVVVP
jgi:hypothetical protein